MPQLLEVFGRFHPLLLHLPIGLIVGLVAIEAIAIVRRVEVPRAVLGWLVALAVASAIVTAASGLVLGSSDADYAADTLDWHRRLGVCVGLSSICFAIAFALRSKFYRVFLLVAAAFMLPAGHLGATLTHGEDFLFGPLHEKPAKEKAPKNVATTPSDASSIPSNASTYASVIAPIFEARCITCHGDAKKKGGLALNTPEAIKKGGKDGDVLAPSASGDAELVRRIKLPLEDDDHMPPDGKAQLSEAQAKLLEAWVKAGAKFEGEIKLGDASSADSGEKVAARNADSSSNSAPKPESAPAPKVADTRDAEGIDKPDAGALAELAKELVHVEVVAAGSNALWIDFSAVATHVDDSEAKRLLEPLRENLAEISLSRSKVGDATAELATTFPHLRRLDLRATNVGDAGVAALAKCAKLEELVIAQTKLTNAAVDSLAAIPNLKRVFLWKCGIDEDGLAKLRAAKPTLAIDDGAKPDAAISDAEKEIKLTSDRPLPGADAPKSADALVATNAKCPVSGDPVNPKYLVVYKGKVIGFCCPNCPKTFWSDPEKFESKLQ